MISIAFNLIFIILISMKNSPGELLEIEECVSLMIGGLVFGMILFSNIYDIVYKKYGEKSEMDIERSELLL
jgi:hypothetical protein